MTSGLAVAPAVWFPTIQAGSGSDVFTSRLCEGLKARGFRAEISWLARKAEFVPWSVRVASAPPWVNVVHVNTWLHRRFVPRHLPLVATLHHSVHDPALRPFKSMLQAARHRCQIKPTERWILHRADAITTVSQYTAIKMREAFGVGSAHVIYNGLNVHQGLHALRPREAHRPFRLLYVGTWSRRKGCDLLAPILQRLGSQFELLYTSDRNHQQDLPSNCRSIGKPSDKDLQQHYLDADALLFPTRLEGFGQVVLEAMSHGLPVISTRGSAIPELVEHESTGILCEQNDVDAFVAAARLLKQDQQLRRRLGENASRRAQLPIFSADVMLDAYISVYRQAIGRASSQACT